MIMEPIINKDKFPSVRLENQKDFQQICVIIYYNLHIFNIYFNPLGNFADFSVTYTPFSDKAASFRNES